MPCYGTPRVRVLECPPLGRPSLIKLVLVNKVGPTPDHICQKRAFAAKGNRIVCETRRAGGSVLCGRGMLSLFVVASSAAAAPLAVAVVDSPAVPANFTNTTAGMNTTADAPLPEASDRRQRPWWERLAEKHRELRKGQSWCVSRSTHASLPRRPVDHKTQLHNLPHTGCNSIACGSRLQEKEGERTRAFRPWLRNRSASRWRPPIAPAKRACCDRCAT